MKCNFGRVCEMKIKILLVTAISLSIVFAGCKNKNISVTNDESQTSIMASESASSNNISEDASSVEVTENKDNKSITPYQYLNLMVGNAEEFSLSYVSKGDTTYFYKKGDNFASVFKAKDMNDNLLQIRELEMEGHVHYIMEDSKIIKSYLAPAEDFLLYQMMDASNTDLIKEFETDGFSVFEYAVPFVQDEQIKITYRFFMKNNTLKKLEYIFKDQAPVIYEFTEFSQEKFDEKVFEFPSGYNEQYFDTQYTGEEMSPWWEIGNDE